MFVIIFVYLQLFNNCSPLEAQVLLEPIARPESIGSVIESSLREIIGNKNFAYINLSLNFCETTIYYDNKVLLENLVAVH